MAPKRKRRKSVRKEVVRIIAEGDDTRFNFTLENGTIVTTKQEFKFNPDLVKFGQINVGRATLKMYGFKNNPELLFVRINGEWIALDKFNARKLMSMTMKGAMHVGIMWKGSRKRKIKPSNTVKKGFNGANRAENGRFEVKGQKRSPRTVKRSNIGKGQEE